MIPILSRRQAGAPSAARRALLRTPSPSPISTPSALLISLALGLAACAPGGGGGSSRGASGTGPSPGATLEFVSIATDRAVLATGELGQLTGTAGYSDGAQVDVTAQLTWYTSDGTVLGIDGGGRVTAQGPGSASITAVYQGIGSTPLALSVIDPEAGLAIVWRADVGSVESLLDGASVIGPAYVSVEPWGGVSSVSFWLDDASRTGPPHFVDGAEPFDLCGGTPAAPLPLDTATLAPGVHRVTAEVTRIDAPGLLLDAQFTVVVGGGGGAPGAPTVSAAPRVVVFDALVGDGLAAPQTVSLAVPDTGGSGGGGVSYAVSGGGSWLTVSGLAGTLPGTITLTADATGQPPGSLSTSLLVTSPGLAPTVLRAVLNVADPAPTAVSSVSQFGITWTFAAPAPAGQFANGDWWVVGPVDVISIAPPSASSGGRTTNGSMVNPPLTASTTQGYDSAMYGAYASSDSYDPALNAALGVSPSSPLTLTGGSSLISTISHDGAGVRPQLRAAAVLTVLDAPAPPGAFRPPYAGSDKRLAWNTSQLRGELLAQLPPIGGEPATATVSSWFERPWIDHIPGFLGREAHPSENMPDYGRDMTNQIAIASLVLLLELPLAEKETLLTRFVQLGIDLWGIADGGGTTHWTPNGGHASGRKWPILFAGTLLGDPEMSEIGFRSEILFGEDAQTFVVEETSPGVFNQGYGGYTATHVGMPEWGIRHQTVISMDNVSLSTPAYRLCCTGNVWVGEVLAARVLNLRSAWNHEALFLYQDRFMTLSPMGDWQRAWDSWTEGMWDAYRAEFDGLGGS